MAGSADQSGLWSCEACTYLNPFTQQRCGVCGATPAFFTAEPSIQPNPLGDQWVCGVCTYINHEKGRKECEMCGIPHGGDQVDERGEMEEEEGEGEEGEGSDDSNVEPKEDEDDSDREMGLRERLAESLMRRFTRVKGHKTECQVDGKQHLTKNLMRAHFLKVHLPLFEGDLSLSNSKALESLQEEADGLLAQQLTMGEDDEEQEEHEMEVGRKRKAKVSSSSSSKEERHYHSSSSKEEYRKKRQRHRREEYSSDDDDRRREVSEGETEEEAILRKRERLQALLLKTDQILEKLASSLAALMDAKGGQKHSEPRPLEGQGAGANATFQRGSSSAGLADDGAKEALEEQPVLLLKGIRLRDYQLEGLQWLISLHNNRLNGILADEMGLGKTIQTLSLLSHLFEKKRIWGPHLVVVPLSVLPNWQKEMAELFPLMKVHVYRGQKEERVEEFRRIAEVASRENEASLTQGYGPAYPFVVLTSYEIVLKDVRVLARTKDPWAYLVVDEAHRLKNMAGRILAAMDSIKCDRRLLLTGTPLQNQVSELYSLLHFIVPSFFDNLHTFKEWFNKPFERNEKGLREVTLTKEETTMVISKLHKVLRPFLLRRTKSEVLLSLPSREERVVPCPLSAMQVLLYQEILKSMAATTGNGFPNQRGEGMLSSLSLSNGMMQLRKVCNHPFLVLDSLRDELVRAAMEKYGAMLVPSCGKFVMLGGILSRLKHLGRRALIFSQMTSLLDYLEEYLEMKGYSYVRLDGNTAHEARTANIEAFNKEGSPYFLFLLSTRAGGLGLNLQSADTVIIYDSDWNPQMDLQAQARVHRIGQEKDVLVLRLVSVGPCPGQPSIEEKVVTVAESKLLDEKRIIGAGQFTPSSLQDYRQLVATSLLATANALPSVSSSPLGQGGPEGGLKGQEHEGEERCRKTGVATTKMKGGGQIRWDLLSDKAISELCARDDKERQRLLEEDDGVKPWEQEQQIEGGSSNVCLMGEDDLPGWFLELQAMGKREQEIVIEGKRKRTARFDNLSDGGMISALQKEKARQLDSKGTPDQNKKKKKAKAKSPVSKGQAASSSSVLEDLGPNEGSEDEVEEEDERPCHVCFSMDPDDLCETMILCDACNGAYHPRCVGLAPHEVPQGSYLCSWCQNEGGAW